MIESKLSKVGPGLGSRTRIWSRVHQKFPDLVYRRFTDKLEEEKQLILKLASGENWEDFIPSEWIDIYNAYYDETQILPIEERELIKIDKDVPRTFGLFVKNARLLRLNFPNDMTCYYNGLRDVLIAVSRDRGYCQGINFIAASILLQTASVKKSSIILNFLLKHRKLEILFDPKYSALLDYMKIFEKRLRKFVPNIYHHFKKCEFTTVSYAIEWFTTCFIVTCPGELSLCMIDLLVAGVDDAMLRIGLGLLKVLEGKLLKLDFEGLHQQFKHLVSTVDPYDVIIQGIPIVVPRRMTILQGMSLRIDALDAGSNGNLKFSSSGGINIESRMKENEESSECDENARNSNDSADEESHSRGFEGKIHNKSTLTSSSMKKPKRNKRHASRQVASKATSTATASTMPASGGTLDDTTVRKVPPAESDNLNDLLPFVPETPIASKPATSTISSWWNNALSQITLLPFSNIDQRQQSSDRQQKAISISGADNSNQELKEGVSLNQAKIRRQKRAAMKIDKIWKNRENTIRIISKKTNRGDNSTRQNFSLLDDLDYGGDVETSSSLERSCNQSSSSQTSTPKLNEEITNPKLHHRLLLIENAQEKFEERDLEETFLDQGGEIIDSAGSQSQLSNFRIASVFDSLQENWFPDKPPKRLPPRTNLILRSTHNPKARSKFVLLEDFHEDLNSTEVDEC